MFWVQMEHTERKRPVPAPRSNILDFGSELCGHLVQNMQKPLKVTSANIGFSINQGGTRVNRRGKEGLFWVAGCGFYAKHVVDRSLPYLTDPCLGVYGEILPLLNRRRWAQDKYFGQM